MISHLWNLARKEDSMWVKWCHMVMLRSKNLRWVNLQVIYLGHGDFFFFFVNIRDR